MGDPATAEELDWQIVDEEASPVSSPTAVIEGRTEAPCSWQPSPMLPEEQPDVDETPQGTSLASCQHRALHFEAASRPPSVLWPGPPEAQHLLEPPPAIDQRDHQEDLQQHQQHQHEQQQQQQQQQGQRAAPPEFPTTSSSGSWLSTLPPIATKAGKHASSMHSTSHAACAAVQPAPTQTPPGQDSVALASHGSETGSGAPEALNSRGTPLSPSSSYGAQQLEVQSPLVLSASDSPQSFTDAAGAAEAGAAAHTRPASDSPHSTFCEAADAGFVTQARPSPSLSSSSLLPTPTSATAVPRATLPAPISAAETAGRSSLVEEQPSYPPHGARHMGSLSKTNAPHTTAPAAPVSAESEPPSTPSTRAAEAGRLGLARGHSPPEEGAGEWAEGDSGMEVSSSRFVEEEGDQGGAALPCPWPPEVAAESEGGQQQQQEEGEPRGGAQLGGDGEGGDEQGDAERDQERGGREGGNKGGHKRVFHPLSLYMPWVVLGTLLACILVAQVKHHRGKGGGGGTSFGSSSCSSGGGGSSQSAPSASGPVDIAICASGGGQGCSLAMSTTAGQDLFPGAQGGLVGSSAGILGAEERGSLAGVRA
ncbi:hypothetical protein DUNSADRAFT_4327 [Dunaliella salina]|uniref:Uncharacterized protein n=1 Tax=Dunaliella salina TaxID=3046 RepID=A0ABQ7H7T3_DUNSA|nr:hypothetical protein DUNSADRAFT_4327 [Dunaliella salina]|eukprot:KAF5842868.1 hypothetical protein DUNSADRAFT_4327 [Dunaliella salina]